jgi:CHASE1-domain containing sensor protein
VTSFFFTFFLDQVIKEYHPRVRFARDAALAAEAVGLQDRYWEMHDTLYREQPVWSSSKSVNDARTLFTSYAETLELDLDRFKRDIPAAQPAWHPGRQ